MEIISTDRAPAAIGPYSQAIKTDHFIFTSGQIPLDPATGKLAEGGVENQAAQALMNLEAVLEAAGSSLNSVVKTTVLLMDMADFAKVNEVYGRFFTQRLPARSAVQVAKLPKDSLVEIEAIACVE